MAQDVKVKISADSSQLQTGLGSASASVDKFSAKTTMAGGAVKKMEAGMKNAGAAGSKAMAGLQNSIGTVVGALAAFKGVKSLMDEGDRIQKLSLRFGETAESIQKVGRVASLAGTDMESVVKAMSKAENNAVEAAKGNTEYDESFKALGLSAEEFVGLSLEEKVAKVADAYANSTNKAEANAAMVKLMGKSAVEMIPLFIQGGDAVREQMGAMSVASTDTVETMAVANDRLAETFDNIKSAAMNSIGWILEKIDQMSIKIAGAIAFWSNLTSGIEAASEAMRVTEEEGFKMLEEGKEDRKQRVKTTNSVDIEDIREKSEKEDADKEAAKEKLAADKAAIKEKEAADKQALKDKEAADKQAQKDLEKAGKDRAKDEKKTKIENATESLNASKERLDEAKGIGGNKVGSDQLKRIGGGFAKSNYSGLSKEEARMNKAISVAEKQYDELKKIVESLKKDTFSGGVTS